MKKTLLAIALSIAAIGASAHVRPFTHYHTNDGRIVIGNQIAPTVQTTYEIDRQGRRVRVVETTSCTETRVNRNNNHLRCIEREVHTQRFVESRPRDRMDHHNGPRGEHHRVCTDRGCFNVDGRR